MKKMKKILYLFLNNNDKLSFSRTITKIHLYKTLSIMNNNKILSSNQQKK